MILNQLEFQRYIQASAKRANLAVEWRPNAIPHTTGDKIVLPILDMKAGIEDYRKQLHYANHEVSHVLYTDFAQLVKRNCHTGNSFLGFIWNAVDDVRIEWLNGKEYEGDRSNTDEIYPALFDKGFKRLTEEAGKMSKERKELMDRVLPLLWFMNEGHSDNYASTAKVKPHLERHLSPEAWVYVKKMQAGTYLDELRKVRDIEDEEAGTEAGFKLAKRIYEEVYGLNAKDELDRLKKEKEEQEAAAKGGSKPKPAPAALKEKGDGKEKGPVAPSKGERGEEEGEGEGGADGPGDEDGDGGDERGDGDADGGRTGRGTIDAPVKAKADKLGTVEYNAFLPTAHEQDDPENREAPGGEGHHVDYEDYRYSGKRTYVPATKDQYFVADFCKNQFTDPATVKGGGGYTYESLLATIDANRGPAFSAQIRTRLQIRSKDRYERGVKNGKLVGSLLHRTAVPDAHEYNQKVFKRQIKNDTLDTAVVWLGDGSGSMSGTKYAQLVSASRRFNDAVGNVIGLPIEIHSFSTWDNRAGEQPLMYVHRDFATRRLADDELKRRMLIAAAHLANNPDGDAILWSYDRLIRHRAKRKLLIVASDGSPACARGGDIMGYTMEVVKKIENETPIEIVGIGIMDDNVRRIYKEHYVINDASELEKALLTLIDKKVR